MKQKATIGFKICSVRHWLIKSCLHMKVLSAENCSPDLLSLEGENDEISLFVFGGMRPAERIFLGAVFLPRVQKRNQCHPCKIPQPKEKEKYTLISLFPNEIAREKAISVLEKGNK